MIALGIDTSALVCSAALVSDDRVLASFSKNKVRGHSELLLSGIDQLFQKANLSLTDLDCIAVAAGPGSFTGLRIGIATAKGLSYTQKIPCCPVSSLEALAYNALSLHQDFIVCPMMDARRDEFYSALFQIKNGNLSRLTEDQAICGVDLEKMLLEYSNLLLLGEGAPVFCTSHPEFLPFCAPREFLLQNAESTAFLGILALKNHQSVSFNALQPTYLRLPQAEREWLKKNTKHQ